MPTRLDFHAYPTSQPRELTLRALVTGTVLGLIFGVTSLYLVLRTGLTVSASIPISFISITFFRLCSKLGFRDATIRENNIVQSAGSSGESVAFAIAVTMPAIMLLGFDLQVLRVTLVAALGALLGILIIIPLRRSLIVQQHGSLKYPEGVACAEVLKAGAAREISFASEAVTSVSQVNEAASGTKFIAAGFGVSFIYYTMMSVFKIWKEYPAKYFGSPFEGGSLILENNPMLLGVGYIIGPRIASWMFAGGVLAHLFLIPAIKFFGGGNMTPLAPESAHLIQDMSVVQIQKAYILFIGVGAMMVGGIFSLCRALPKLLSILNGGLSNLRDRRNVGVKDTGRTKQDLSGKLVIGSILLLFILLLLFRTLHLNLTSALMVLIFGSLCVAIAAHITGQVGSSSIPITGLTMSTLMLTSLVFIWIGWSAPIYYLTALSVGAIVCVAVSNGSTASQCLKTGFLIGATPKYQHIAMLIGSLCAALVIGPLLIQLNNSGTVYIPRTIFEKVNKPPLKTVDIQKLKPDNDVIKPPIAGSYLVSAEPLGETPESEPERSPASNSSGASNTHPRYLVDETSGKIVYWIQDGFPQDLRVKRSPQEELADLDSPPEKLQGKWAATDNQEYRVWHKSDNEGGPAGRYLVSGDKPIYFVDPGINGLYDKAPDGSPVGKFTAPKATLFAYIIKGTLTNQLPWGLILIGGMIALCLELCNIPSLPVAVGLYLPISTSSPIFVGGLIKRLIERRQRRRGLSLALPMGEATSNHDRTPGSLLASGYIVGPVLAGIVIAPVAYFFQDLSTEIEDYMTRVNPFYEGSNADLLSLIPFFFLCLLLYSAASGRFPRLKRKAKR